MSRRLVLLRHGRTEWNHALRAQGHSDVPLDAEGEAQAKAVAPVLAAMDPVAVWTSDLARASGTARAVADQAGLEPVHDARLREFSMGTNRVGLTLQEYADQHPVEHAALVAGDIGAIPGRESDEQVLARFLPALTSYADELADGETGILVSHGAAIRVAVPAFLGWPAGVDQSLGVLANCGWVELEHSVGTWTPSDARWRLRAWNRVVS
ncbi:histidine phosphatase family protein [Nocardioides oleivorans]|uniref:Histidine phosphatase family protein n=1 Tax=Nocardioides oleivorans TaxID=273676 RepID=A0A4Q2RQX8_9ACTN|nr:histidine phosphatase family protein [Nocardioides oleivorans]RYB91098.1 histidine phosphatase family protein [Nocardioides oleivorans]